MRYANTAKKIFCGLILVGLALSARTASAEVSAARQALSTRIDEVITVLKSPEFANQTMRAAQIDKIDAIIRTIFDFEQFSARTVGVRWRQFTPTQKKNFEDAFAQLLRATYLDKLQAYAGYTGEKVIYTGEVPSSKGDKVEIQTLITMQDKNIPVFYRMLERGGKWAVYDVIIEGVSLVQNYRTQFQELLSKGTPEQLIARIKDQAKKIREQPAQTGTPGAR